jgi:hypothetical protein
MSWDPDFLRGLHELSLEEARRVASDLVNSGTTKPSKKAHLIRDFMSAKSSAEVSRIMYNAMLAGTGFGIQGSAWQRLHGGSK